MSPDLDTLGVNRFVLNKLKSPKPQQKAAVGRQITLDDIGDIKDDVGGVDFQQAAREGSIKVIQRYLQSNHFRKKMEKVSKGGKNPIDTLDGQGTAAMHYAARYNNLDIIELLLEHGGDINVKDEEGQTPLHHASRFAPKGTALNPSLMFYVPRGPAVEDKDDDEEEEEEGEEKQEDTEEPVEEGEEQNNVIQVQPQDEETVFETKKDIEDAAYAALRTFLKKKNSTKNKFKKVEDQIAEEEGSPPIKFLAANGADVNAQDDYGLTPLHCAADRGNYPAVLELVKLDTVQVNLGDMQGETALHMAVCYEDVACIKKLMFNPDHPCNPRIYSNVNMSPLHLACREADLEIVELVFYRIKSMELKDSLDSLFSDENIESRQIKALLTLIGVKSVASYPKHTSSLIKKLHKKAKEVDPENYRSVKVVINQKFQKAMEMTDLKMQSHLNRAGEENMTCLHLACKDGRVDVVEFLVSNDADMSPKTSERETCLHLSAHRGHMGVVKKLVEMEVPLQAKNLSGGTALHEAAKADQTEVIEFLINSGANIEARDKEGLTPLITASAWGHPKTVTLLLENGADVNARDKRENSATFAAIQENNPGVLKIILDAGGDRLIDSELDRFQNTPLHFAAKLGHLECLKELLNFHFEINAQNEDDKCPLHLAAEYGRVKCAKELVKRDRCTIEDKDDLGNHPLHYAALNGHVDTTIFLCDVGAEVGCRNQNGWTPLDCAASRGNTKVMTALVDADAEIDPMDKAQLTPLHLASKNGHVDAVMYLLDNEADIRLVDVNNMNALELAILGNKQDVAEAIINHVNDGKSTWPKALTNAQSNGDTPMKKLIRSMPDTAELVLNKCTDLNRNPPEMTSDNVNFQVQFNYKYVTDTEQEMMERSDDTKSLSSADIEESESGSKIEDEEEQRSYHIHPLSLMIKYKRSDLLSHPLVTSLIFARWCNYGQHFYYGNLLIYALYLAALTAYAIVQIPPFDTIKDSNGDFVKSENCISSDACLHTEGKSVWVFVTGLAAMVVSVLRLVIELTQLIYQKHKYVTVQNLTEIALFALSIYFTINIFFVDDVISSVQWQIGVFCLLAAWMNFLMFLRKFPGIGIYIVMFVEVFGTFLKIGLILVLFIVAFGLTFNMVMAQYPSYQNPGYAILRTFVMMTGELEFDNYFAPADLHQSNPLYYPAATLVMFVVFAVVVPIVFMNLLVGLAVDDIKAVYDQAELQRSIMKIQLIFQVEVLLPTFFLENKNKSKQTFFPNLKKRIMGSRVLAKYLTPYQVPFSGPELCTRVTYGGEESKILVETSKIKKLKYQMNEISKQNKQILLLLRRLISKTKADDTDSTFSSEMEHILFDSLDLEEHEDN